MRRKPAADSDAAAAFRDAVMARAHGRCEVCPVIREFDVVSIAGQIQLVADAMTGLDIARDCSGSATDAHHRLPRGMGGHGDNDPSNGVAACHRGHMFLESHRKFAYALGLLERHRS